MPKTEEEFIAEVSNFYACFACDYQQISYKHTVRDELLHNYEYDPCRELQTLAFPIHV